MDIIKKLPIFVAHITPFNESDTMEIKFNKEYLRELYETGKATDKRHRFQPQIVLKYRKTIDLLESLDVVEDLYRYHSLNYEVLKGDKAGLESVRVNNQYRIEFKTEKVVSEIVVTVCNIMELSNHFNYMTKIGRYRTSASSSGDSRHPRFLQGHILQSTLHDDHVSKS